MGFKMYIHNFLLITTLALCSCATSQASQNRMPAEATVLKVSNIGQLVEYKDGILIIEIDTCGGVVSPVVTFKPLEEVVDPSALYGIYKATIAKSVEQAPNTMCPYNGPTRFTLDLKKLWKDWSDSTEGSTSSRKISEAGGDIEISVSTFSAGINFKIKPTSTQKQ